MNKIKDFFSTKNAVFYVKLATYVLAVIGAIVYVSIDYGDVTYSSSAFALVLVGGIAGICLLILNIPSLALIPVLLLAVGVGLHGYAALPSITDLFTGVVLFGGNQELGITFLIWFMCCALICTVCCFFNDRTTENKIFG